jgi:HK97 family phage major capsid protein
MTTEFREDTQTPASAGVFNYEVPQDVIEAMQHGLQLQQLHNRGGSEVSIALAQRAVQTGVLSGEDVDRMRGTLETRMKPENRRELDKVRPDGSPATELITFLLYGGEPGYKWTQSIAEQTKYATKPYTGANDPKLPSHIQALPREKRRQWVGVWNNIYEQSGDEGQAFTVANGAVKHFGKSVGFIKSARIGGYLARFTGVDDPDQEGEYFNEYTDFALDWYDKIPVFLEHTVEDKMPRKVKIGDVILKRFDEEGLYIEAELDDTELATWALSMIKRGLMFWSSGSAGHLRRVSPDGHNYVWPIVEASITEIPAEADGTDVLLIENYYKSIGAGEAYKALLTRVMRHDASESQSRNKKDKTTMSEQTTEVLDQDIEHPVSIDLVKVHSLLKDVVSYEWDSIKTYMVKQDEPEGGTADESLEPIKEENIAERLQTDLRDAVERIAVVTGAPIEQVMAMAMSLAVEKAKEAMDKMAVPQEEYSDKQDEYEDEMLPEEPLEDAMARTGFKRDGNRQVGYHYTPKPARRNGKTSPAVREDAVKRVHQVWGADGPITSMVKAQVYQDRRAMLRFARENAKSNYYRRMFKAMGTTPDNLGGYLVPEILNDEAISALYDESLMLSGKLPSIINMPGKILSVPRMGEALTVGWVGENSTLTDNDQEWETETLTAKKAYAMIRISEEELEDAVIDLEQWFSEQAPMALGELVDQAVLEGTGIGSQPLGISTRTDNALQKTALNAVPTYDNMVDLRTRLTQSKIKIDSAGNAAWVVNPREVGTMSKMVDDAGNLVWTGATTGMNAVDGPPPTFYGMPVYFTNQVSIDTANDNETIIYGGRWKDVWLGIRKSIEIRTSRERYFDQDQIAIRAIVRCAVGMARIEAIEMLTDVRA